MPKAKNVNFETALADLTKLVEHLEQGDLSLEASLKQFEAGIALTAQCEKAIQEAEQKVKILVEQNKEHQLEDFEPDQDA